MTFDITSLVTPVTADQALQQLLSVAQSLGLPTTSWQSGSPILTMLSTVAQKLADQSVVSATIAKGGFGDLLPSDPWADLWAQSRFNVPRVAALPATGFVNFTNSSVTTYTKNPGEVIVSHATSGQTYRNTQAISILAGTGLANVAIQADVVGSIGNAAPGAISVLVTSLTGVGVTNPLSVLGNDAETTAALVARARLKLAALSPSGTRGIYDFVALTPSLAAVGTPITRTLTVADPATGLVTVYLATANGAPVGGDITIVQAALDKWATPWCVTATATAASTVSQAVTYQVWVKGSSLTATQIQSATDTAVATFFATLPIGGQIIPPATGKLYVNAIRQAIAVATPGIQQVTVTVPAADLSMSTNQVATLGALSGTVTIL